MHKNLNINTFSQTLTKLSSAFRLSLLLMILQFVSTPSLAASFVNGACGGSANQSLATLPTTGLCSAGLTTAVGKTNSWGWWWNCLGENGGTSSFCWAPKPQAVSGVCGGSANQSLATLPTTGLCSAGSTTAVGETNSWGWWWNCLGINGGRSSFCWAPKPQNVSCTDAQGVSHASGTNYELPISQIQNSIAATPTQCVYGGTQSVLMTTNQYYACTNGTQVAQSGPVTTTTKLGSPVCTPPSNGACGSANGIVTNVAPTDGFCSSGNASVVSGIGPWLWTCNGSNGGSTAACTALNPGEVAKQADVFVDTIGVNTHLGWVGDVYYNNFSDITLPAVIKLGVRHIRESGYLYTAPNWQTQNFVTLAQGVKAASGVTLAYDLVVSPSDCSNLNLALPQNITSWLPMANIGAFEGMNEEDSTPFCAGVTWDTQEREFQTALYNATKNTASLSSLPVYGPSLVGAPSSAQQVGNLSSVMDYGNMHSYPGNGMPTNALQNENILSAMNAGKPYVATETGYHNDVQTSSGFKGVSEAAAGKYIPRLLFNYFNAGVVRTYLYELLDDNIWTDFEAHFGLMHSDGTPKAAFTAIQNSVALLNDLGTTFTPGSLSYSVQNAPDNYAHTLLEKRDGSFWLVMWDEVSTFNGTTNMDLVNPIYTVTIQLGKVANEVDIFDPSIGPSPTGTQTMVQTFTVPVTDKIVIVKIAP